MISPSLLLRQRPDRYAFRAGRNLPDKEFRYLRTVIVTAAVSIARALVNDPAVLLADEATGNLDTRTSFEILVLFQQLHAMGRTIIFVTHNPEIAQYSSRNITLRDGLIREDTLNSNILSAAEALAQLPLPQDD